MKNSLIISELSYLEPIKESESSVVVGGQGVYADTVATTTAGPGYAIAVVGAFATGNDTYTNTTANTTLKDLGSLEFSRAKATGTAYASTRNQTASSTIRSTSISFFGR
ncbi:MAG: TonB-dependent receptor [Microcoleus sp.]